MSALGEWMDAGRFAEASEQTRKRLAQNPGDPEALLVMAQLSLQTGRVDEAEQFITRAATSKAPADEVVMVRAAIACERRDWTKARDLYESLVRQPQFPAAAWYGLGVALLALGDLAGAYAAQQRAVQLGPRQPSVHFELGRILAVQDKPRAAARAFLRTLSLEARDPRAYGALAQVLVALGKVRSARRVVDVGLRQLPGSPELLQVRGALPQPPESRQDKVYKEARELLDRKRTKEALKLLRDASAQGVRTVPLKLMEAEACAGLMTPDVPGALQAYEEAQAMDPHGWVVGSNLGLFLQQQGYRYMPRAIEVLEETHRRAPTRPEPALNLALAYHKTGRTADSLAIARQLEADLPMEHPLYPQARLLVQTLGGV